MRRASDSLLTQVPAVREALGTPGRSLHKSEQSMLGNQLPRSDISTGGVAQSTQMTSPGDTYEREAYKASRGMAGPRHEKPSPHDFSNIRVHTDGAAADSARAIGARAYAVGNDIVFGGGQFAPQQDSGRRLLAHELAHTVQPGSENRVARAVTEMETTAINIARTDIEKLATGNYWEQKIGERFDIVYVNPVSTRFAADAEERDAALSAVWAHKPAGAVKTDVKASIAVPPRAGAPKSEPLLLDATFSPPGKGAKLPSMQLRLKEHGATALVSQAAPAPAGYTPPQLKPTEAGFPDGMDKYWQDHPDEHKQLYQWIDNAPAKFEQMVTTNEVKGKKKHESTYRLKGEKDNTGKLTTLKITLLRESAPFIENPPAGYAKKDRLDLEIEKLQAKSKDKLGKVTGLDKAPADEQLSVKYMIDQYFSGGTRNKEVDVAIPIANKTTTVYYTLRFQPVTNDVEVERVGEEGSSPQTTAGAMNIARVEGFAQNSKDTATFSTWVAKRYPAVTAQGKTLPELQDSVNSEMKTKAGTPEWFKKNYTMEILDATKGATRLQTAHKLSAAETADMKDYSTGELEKLEFSMQTMSDPQIQIFSGTHMARQKVLLEIENRTLKTKPKTSGIARQRGSDRTVTIFDNAEIGDNKLFAGGSGGVRPASVQVYTHELGHLLGSKQSIESAFKKKFAKAKPITWYAKSKPATESFPEAFAMYQTDPEWMSANLPDMFAWFEEVKKTGAPPSTP